MPVIKSNKGYYMTISGRYGITFYDEDNNEFFIDSEMLNSPDFDISISRTDISKVNSDVILSQEQKDKILYKVMDLCKEANIKVLLDQ